MSFWVSLIGYQLVWFARVIGAGHGLSWPSLLVVALYMCAGSAASLTPMQALRSRGDDYRAYQRSTPLLLPWFPSMED